jgi:4-hydroxy-tetrahydrodipicolinate synthase
MISEAIKNGVWPTMITPFTNDNKIDFAALEKMIEWYIQNGVDGLFAVCQSSEMFFLSIEERVQLARFVKKQAGNRVQVIASGHISDSFEDQVKELNLIAETGVDAVVLISNRMAAQGEPGVIWMRNIERLLKNIYENVPLGFYECPYPYKRIISPGELKYCAETGRFYFLKDTSCDIKNMDAKLHAVKGSGLKIFNANSATLLETLKMGVSGFSGVMANFHPDLYVWLTGNWDKKPAEAKRLSDFLSVASLIERQLYPVNAKYNMNLEGIEMSIFSRSKNHKDFTSSFKLEVEQLNSMTKEYREYFMRVS